MPYQNKRYETVIKHACITQGKQVKIEMLATANKNERKNEMPKFKFVEREETERVIVFEALNNTEAVNLMEDLSVDDLPNVTIFDYSGTTYWSDPKEYSEVA